MLIINEHKMHLIPKNRSKPANKRLLSLG